MPRYSIRVYYTYVDEFHVEARDITTAQLMAETYEQDGPCLTRVVHQEFADYDSTYGNEIASDGTYTSDPEEL